MTPMLHGLFATTGPAALFWLLALHFLCDFSLQGDTMAREKNPGSRTELQAAVPWYYWLAAHSFTHGASVALVTGSASLGLLEIAAHFFIDYKKCLGTFSIHVDQALHIACKFWWVLLAYG